MAGTPTDSVIAPHPVPPQRPPAGRRAPVLLAAAVTAGWAAVVSYVSVLAVVTLLVMVSGGAPVPVVLRFGTGGWLLAHGVPLHTGAGPLGLVPLAVSALAAWRVNRAGMHTTRAIGARRSGSVRRWRRRSRCTTRRSLGRRQPRARSTSCTRLGSRRRRSASGTIHISSRAACASGC